ncbi:MAG: hypothetical protein V8T87_02580, partial [Victivallales bacterium]
GIIWKSTDAPLDKRMPAGFCNYLYLGGFHRGLCVFAENDRNWGWKHGTPNMDIVRRGNAMVAHPSRQCASFRQPEADSFLRADGGTRQAASERLGRDGSTTGRVMGTDVNWLGGPGCCACVYPPGRKTIFWEPWQKPMWNR